jgi:hypothetical protein
MALRSGPASTRAVAKLVPDAPAILLRNVHGWFERISRGVYALTAAGDAAAQAAAMAAPTPGGEPTTPAP